MDALLKAVAYLAQSEASEADITEVLPSGVVTVKDFREVVELLLTQSRASG